MKNENTDVNLDFLDKTLSENTDYAANNLVDYAMEGNIKRSIIVSFLKRKRLSCPIYNLVLH